MQSQEPPAPDGERPLSGHARHRRHRTDPPVPPDGAPLDRREPPRTVADYLGRRGEAVRATAPPPPWAQDRADPHGRLDEPVPAAGWTRSSYTDVAEAPDLKDGPASGGPDPRDDTDWFTEAGPTSPPTGVAAVPSPAGPGPGERSPGGPVPGEWSPAGPVPGEPAGSDGGAVGPEGRTTGGRVDGDPPERSERPVPRPRPSPGPRRPAPVTPDADDAEPVGRPDAAPVVPAERPRPGPPTSGGDGPAGTPPERPSLFSPFLSPSAVAETPQETTGPVLERLLRDSGTGSGAGSGDGSDLGLGPGSDMGPSLDLGSDSGSRRGPGSGAGLSSGFRRGSDSVPGTHSSTGAAPGPDSTSVVSGPDGVEGTGGRSARAHVGAHTGTALHEHPDGGDSTGDPYETALRPEPAPPRRRTPRTEADHPRTVSDVARERGLPVRDIGSPPTATGTGHGHGHSPATPAGKRVRILLAALLVPCALAALAGVALLWPGTSPVPSVPPQQQVHGDVRTVQAADCTPGSGSGGCTGVTVRMTDGPRAGSDLVQLVPAEPSTPRFAVGDRIVLAWSGANPDDAGSYQITDFQRTTPLIWLAGAFAVAVLLLGRWRGLAALVALGLTFVVLTLFVLPSILSGNNPLAVAVTGAGVIMFVVLYLSHGFSARTSCAVLGTLVSLAMIGGLGALFTVTTRLTGLDDTTANLIGTIGNVPIDARGLVLAGLVIGALGVLDDVTVTQASAVWELRDANASLGPGKLFAAGMRIGRDHVSSAVNTLVLAYAGAALPLMLLFTVSSASFGQVVTSQDVATEIVRTLVGSIGLVASVPLTTGLAAVVAARR